ncbi:MAG: integrase [Deltaproteobacteria bacterium]|nr:integrase [Deltaproteobacteria bacterium]
MPKTYLLEPKTGERQRSGPIDPYLDTIKELLTKRGYALASIQTFVWAARDFGRWLMQRENAAGDVNEAVVEAFVEERQRQSRLHRNHRPAVRLILEHLQAAGVAPRREPLQSASPVEQLVGRYEEYLRVERALTEATVVNYRPFVSRFLAERFENQLICLRNLVPSDIQQFMLRRAPLLSPGRAKLMGTALRSFFRFLLSHGEIDADLAAAVLPVADRRALMPKYISAEDVQRMLGAVDRGTVIGRRNYALLLLLSRLGLRGGEVVALELSDIEWRAGEITVPGKGLRRERLPLPHDVGEALAAYLQDRPRTPATRRVFIRTKAPQRGFANTSTISTIVRRALARADLHPPTWGAHLLRHSLATGMIRTGASMAEIGQLLRHRSPATTERYAKVDFEGLRALALRWPGAGGGR